VCALLRGFYNRCLHVPLHNAIMSVKPSPVASLDAELAAAISPVSEIISELKMGRMVILVDEEDRENEITDCP